MYKVFFKDRIVFLTNNIERDLSNDFGAIFKYSNPKELSDFIGQFIANDKINKAFIYHHDIDTLLKLFSQYFKVIDAAGGLVFNNKNEILFIYRLGRWDLPKGKVETGESIEEAALREVEEECGITGLKIGNEIESTYHIYQFRGETILKKTFWYKMYYNGNEQLTPQIEEDIEKVEWLKTENLNNVYKNTFPGIALILNSNT